MSDRIRTLTVILEKDMRDDDVEVVVDALKMVKYVDSVYSGKVADYDSQVASSDFRRETGKLLTDVISASCHIGMNSEAEQEFLRKIKGARTELCERRGY